MINRTQCVICESNNLEELCTFKNMPAHPHISKMGDADVFYDQAWVICKDCGCIQLLKLIPLDELYGSSHNSIVGKTWELHNESFASYIEENSGQTILELGGGNLSIAQKINLKEKTTYKIYDSWCAKNIIPHPIKFSPSFFDPYNNNEKEESYDTVILSHTIEHFYNPIEYLKELNKILKDSGRIILSVPDIISGISAKFTNALNFEHTYSINEEYLEYMMNIAGFKKIEDIDYNQYNFFAIYEKTTDIKSFKIENQYESNKKWFNEYVNWHKKNVEYLNKELYKRESNRKYIFGCGPFSQFTIYNGLDKSKILYVLDEDINKTNYELYGTGLKTKHPNIIKEYKDPVVILQAGVYTTEIACRLMKINPSTIIIY